MKPFRGMAQTISIIQRKSWKIQRKISNVSILIFQACKSVHELLRGIGLHFWDPDASFDTHIAIYRCDMGQIVNTSNMKFLAFLTWMTHIWHLTFVMSWYGNMGVKRSALTSGTQTNDLKQLVHRFNGLKLNNKDFRDFPLYFSRFPLYNVSGKCYVDISPMN